MCTAPYPSTRSPMRSIRVATTPTAASSSYADRARRQWRAVDQVLTCTASSLQRRPQSVAAYPATPARKPKQGDVCRKMVQAFSITQTARFVRNWGRLEHMAKPGCCRARAGRSDGGRDAEQLRTADTSEPVERERLPRDASRHLRVSLDVSVSADASSRLHEKN
jgi:hypothetical protein